MLLLLIYLLVEPSPEPEILWNQDGSWGAYTITTSPNPSGAAYGPGTATRLYAISKDRKTIKLLVTGEWPRLTKSSSRSDEFVYPGIAMWAPDGEHILFFKGHLESVAIETRGVPLFDASIKSGKVRLLSRGETSRSGVADFRMPFAQSIAFSPDGEHLLLCLGTGKHSSENKRLALLEYKTLRRTWVTGSDFASSNPAWSPDGKRIVYSANPAAIPDKDRDKYPDPMYDYVDLYFYQRIWVMDSDGTNKRQLTDDAGRSDAYPKWTDHHVIQFLREAETGPGGEVWQIRPDGSHLKFVKKLQAEESNVWRYGHSFGS